MNFKVLWPFAKAFSIKYKGVMSFGGTSEQSVKVIVVIIFFPPIREGFLP